MAHNAQPLATWDDIPRKERKRCIKCRQWYRKAGPAAGFGKHTSSSDGFQSICLPCKQAASRGRQITTPAVRIRHHFSSRMLLQLGELAPDGFTGDMEDYLGYKIRTLVKALGADLREREGPKRLLRNALQEGYHIDHIKPLSSFKVVVGDPPVVDWDVFRKCWAIENLSAIPGEENLKKGASQKASTGVKKKRDRPYFTNINTWVKHNFSTRMATQLRIYIPDHFTRDLENYLGYTISDLVEYLERSLDVSLYKALERGDHIDHIRPLVYYRVVRGGEVNWDTFRQCWAMENLQVLSREENLKKGNKRWPSKSK